MCVLSSYTPTIKRRTSSPSLSMVHGLNHFVRPLVLVQFLDSLVWCVLHIFIMCQFCLCWGTHYFVGFLYSMILFVCFCCFYIVVFDQFFSSYVSKIQKSHKKNRKSKSLIDIVDFCLKTCFALYLCANGFVHFRA